LSYQYDAVGNLISVSDNVGVSVSSSYDVRDLLLERTWQGGGVDAAQIEFSYDAAGRRTEARRFADASGAELVGRTAFDYDANGHLTDLTHRDALDAVLADYDYVFDQAEQLIEETHHGQVSRYDHDLVGQLLAADHSLQDDESYTYDENGNRIDANYVVGANNQILADGLYDYQYDAEGNRTRKTEIATGNYSEYSYDHRSRLVRVQEMSTGGIILHEVVYTYDVFDRRIAKLVDPDGQGPQGNDATRFVYDGPHVWADFDAVGSVLARYLFGDRIDEIVARYRPSEGTVWYLADRLGTIRDLAGASGTIIDHIDYDSFGNVILETNPLVGDRFRFTGREFDVETGLYYFRARYYDAQLGRFISEDPIRFSAGDTNLYRYVGNQPLDFVDPSGLTAATEESVMLKKTRREVYAATMLGCLTKALLTQAARGLAGGPVGLTPLQAVMIIATCHTSAAAAADAAAQAAGQAAGAGDQPGQPPGEPDGGRGAGPGGARGDSDATETIPEKIFRGGRHNDSAIKDIRVDADGVSFRDSLSNPVPSAGEPPAPVLRPGKPFIEVDTSKLPPGNVMPDNSPPGHVNVTATRQEIVNAITGGGRFPRN
jgi:RHS repeat-associated protein